MGLTKRKDSWYVEFPVIDDGNVLQLARGRPGAKLKRWKTLTTNKTLAKQQEAIIKTDLMKGNMKSERDVGHMTFRALAKMYLESPIVPKQGTYKWKKEIIEHRLVPKFGKKLLDQITPLMIERYREKGIVKII